eukprot:COSAG01_NODE_3199_length_6426_cov_6.255726_3_plen_83_part_00
MRHGWFSPLACFLAPLLDSLRLFPLESQNIITTIVLRVCVPECVRRYGILDQRNVFVLGGRIHHYFIYLFPCWRHKRFARIL